MNFVRSLNLFGIEAKEIPCLTDGGAPTAETAGAVGLLYMDILSGKLYKCTAATASGNTWVEVAGNGNGGGISVVATREWYDGNIKKTTKTLALPDGTTVDVGEGKNGADGTNGAGIYLWDFSAEPWDTDEDGNNMYKFVDVPTPNGVTIAHGDMLMDSYGNVYLVEGVNMVAFKPVFKFCLSSGNVDLTGVVKSVNGQTPDENGNVEITVSGGAVLSGGVADINIKKWFGKKIVVDGSSITTGGTGLTQPTWFSFIKDMFALNTVYNHAGSGTCWVGSYNENNAYNRIDEYEADADAVIMMGDYNNSHYTWGEITDAPNINGSYYARLKALAEKLIAKYPLCPVIWVIEPPRSPNWTPMDALDTSSGIYNVAKAIREVAEVYGFPVCDCLRNAVFRPWIQANYDATTSDGVHPWNNVQRTMAQVIAETMKRTPIFYNESYVVTPDDSTSGETDGDSEKVVVSLSVEQDGEIFEKDSASVVRNNLTVKAKYSDLSEAVVTDYQMTGELTPGTPVLTISYGGVTTTKNISVTEGVRTVTVNLKDIDHTPNYILLNNREHSLAGYAYSDYISVTPNTTITLAWSNSGWQSMICCYDENKNYVSSIKGVYGTSSYALPENAYYVRVNGNISAEGIAEQTITYVPRA